MPHQQGLNAGRECSNDVENTELMDDTADFTVNETTLPFSHAPRRMVWKRYFLWLAEVSPDAACLNPHSLCYTFAQNKWIFVRYFSLTESAGRENASLSLGHSGETQSKKTTNTTFQNLSSVTLLSPLLLVLSHFKNVSY